jgi:hypothetical protein
VEVEHVQAVKGFDVFQQANGARKSAGGARKSTGGGEMLAGGLELHGGEIDQRQPAAPMSQVEGITTGTTAHVRYPGAVWDICIQEAPVDGILDAAL